LNILYLYAEIVPSWIPTFTRLVEGYGAHVHVVHWDDKRNTPYEPPSLAGVTFYKRSEYNNLLLCAMIEKLNPVAIVVSGWMDKGYLKAIWRASSNIPVVVAFDDWWRGTIRQRVGSLLPRNFRQRLFSHAWVAGPRQYEFAKRIGFQDREIIHSLLTADTDIFSSLAVQKVKERANAFLYVGRFSPEKGIATLIAGFRHYRDQLGGSWGLRCVGNGPLAPIIDSCQGAELIDFVDARKLAAIHQESQVLIVPSDRDFFGLVLQEAAASSLPILWSTNVGGSAMFCINEYNGFEFPAGDAAALAAKMLQFERLHADRLTIMGRNSKTLSLRNSPEICAASLMSIARKE
jgi:glycosyltransferase involved in cell wall biosynthesis